MNDEYAPTFCAGLLNPNRALPTDVVAHPGQNPQTRYNVYRNNVTVSLIDALAAIYPAVQRITGVEFFRAMARFHVRACPPSSPLLFDYGRDFPAFIESYPYAQNLPWLADTARIERAWLDAYHAADAPVLQAQDLVRVPEPALNGLRLHAHPATRLVQSPYPAVAIFAMNKQDGPVSTLTSSEAQNALVTRPDEDVIVSNLSAAAAAFLCALLDGLPLGDAAATAFDTAPDFDLSASLAAMITAGAFTTIQMES